jgi:hypothetical protein
MAFSIGGFFSKIGSVLHNFFTKDSGAIQTGIAEALSAAKVVASVAAIADPTGSAPLIAEIGKVQDGLALVSKGVTSASTATDLNGHAAALAGLVTGLVTSGDLNIKNAQTQAAIGVMATKVQSVVGVLETAAGVAPAGV